MHCLQLVGCNHDQTRAELGKIPIVGGVFQCLEVDPTGPFVDSRVGNKFLLVVTDRASQFVHAAPLRNISALAVAKALLKYFSFAGFPKELVSDRGPQFMSKLVTKLWELADINVHFPTAFHPLFGLTEHSNQSVLALIRKYVQSQGKRWDQFIHSVALHLNNSVSEFASNTQSVSLWEESEGIIRNI